MATNKRTDVPALPEDMLSDEHNLEHQRWIDHYCKDDGTRLDWQGYWVDHDEYRGQWVRRDIQFYVCPECGEAYTTWSDDDLIRWRDWSERDRSR